MKKFLYLTLIILFITPYSFAKTTIDNLDGLKKPAYRLGVTDEPEKEYKITDIKNRTEEKTAIYEKQYLRNSTYADSSLKDLSDEISKLLTIEKTEMLEHIQILWAGAALRSETIKFALYKLSNPDEDKPKDSIIKKIIRPLSTATSIAGAGLGDPFSATAALFGGHFLNSLSFNDKDLNYKYTKVTDADMIVLITKIDNMQKKVLDKYFDYMTAYNMLSIAEKNIKKREERYNSGIYTTKEQLIVADAFYRTAIDTKSRLELEFLEHRASLEQIAGIDALLEFEKKLSKN